MTYTREPVLQPVPIESLRPTQITIGVGASARASFCGRIFSAARSKERRSKRIFPPLRPRLQGRRVRPGGDPNSALGTTHSRDREMLGDPIFWIFVLPGLLLGAYAQSRIKINIAKYSQVGTQDGITGAQVARRLLDSQGLRNVAVESTPGMLSDHYDPRSKTLRLSQGVYFAPSVAAAGIAAHEAGHALQDAVDYFPLEARTYIVPVVQLASQTAPWLFITGVMLQLPTLAWVGVILFGASSVFALITLPVEFNASARAQELLIRHGIIRGDEQIAGVQKVLGAAAWTYVLRLSPRLVAGYSTSSFCFPRRAPIADDLVREHCRDVAEPVKKLRPTETGVAKYQAKLDVQVIAG